jgi:hypothetical protein
MESRLLLFRMRVALAPLSSRMGARGEGMGQACHVHGHRDWGRIWDALVREGEASGVRRIELAIEMTAAGEIYHGHWSLPTASPAEPHWSVVHSIRAGGVAAGVIHVSGDVDTCGSPYLDKVEKLVRVVECRIVSEGNPSSSSGSSTLSGVDLSSVHSALT